ncbi:MAG: hypothetical protein R2748_34530 [Bryobacterales bacterium]
MTGWTRRGFMAAAGMAPLAAPALAQTPQTPLPKVAAIITEFRHRSHADVICTRILDGYYPNGIRQDPRTKIVSMWTDQVNPDDMSRGLAYRKRFTCYGEIEQALTLGGKDLAVDAVLMIGEHGDYPDNARGQKLYPRHRIMKGIVDVFRKTGKTVPLFSDKHLSYSWDLAKEMYDWSRELNFPFMAGSSIPVTVRTPELEIRKGAKIKHAVQAGYGPLDAYGFHTLESMQCMVERRAGGETGVASVELLEGDAVWRWRDGEGKWSIPLLEKALSSNPHLPKGRMEEHCKNPALFILRYRDGLEACAYMLNNYVYRWDFAAEVDGRIVGTHFGQVPETRDLPHFDGLTWCIEELFVTGKSVRPIERTLLVTGALAFAFESREKKRRIETPQLAIRYEAPEHDYFQRS